MAPDDAIFLNEGDTMLCYMKHPPIVGKYADVWFSSYIDEYERDNYITLGRVTRMEKAKTGPGMFLVTKLGRFIVEEMYGECKREEMASNHCIQ